jgi:hypothetical protein
MWALIINFLIRDPMPAQVEYFATEAQCVVRLNDWSAAAIAWQWKVGGVGGGSFAMCRRAEVMT